MRAPEESQSLERSGQKHSALNDSRKEDGSTFLVLFVFWLTRDESLELSNRTLFSFQEFRPLHVHGALESKVHPNILKQLDEVQERILEEVRIASGHLFGRH